MSHTNVPDTRRKAIHSLNVEIDKGLASLEAGKGIDGQTVYDDLLKLRSLPLQK